LNILRTPDERFASLPDFPFAPRYVELGDGLRVHYVDEGPPSSAPVLLLHGEPTWSYLYRSLIPILVAAGHRCVAPDLVGFGRSDKPSRPEDYSYQGHVDWMREALFDRLDLRDLTLVAQDWGGLIGLRLLAQHPERFARAVVANTGLPTGDRPPREGFLAWRQFARDSVELPAGTIVSRSSVSPLSDAEIAAYDAPFPDQSFKAGARVFPTLVPTSPDDPAHDANVRAWEALERFEGPFLCAFSDGDPIFPGGQREFIDRVPGAAGFTHPTIEGAGHFLQEDKGPELARVIAEFIGATGAQATRARSST
jgi:haloalkane dehalogenase